jgi:hypothetical protein
MSGLSTLELRGEPVPLGGGFSVAFSWNRGRIGCEWAPKCPRGFSTLKQTPAYRNARDAFVREVSERSGVFVGVIEL